MTSPLFRTEHINIVDLLRSTIALEDYRGKEVCNQIEEIIKRAPDYTTVLFDIRQVDWLNTGFCQPAFGPIFQALKENRWKQKFIIFQMEKHHKKGFFQGILKHFNIDIPREKSESEFISSDMYVKLIIGDTSSIDFIGNLNDNDRVILQEVNTLKQASTKDVVERTDILADDVVDTLRLLAREKYFIIESDTKGYYFSFYKYFTS